MDLDNLFRDALEGQEITPSHASEKALMKRLGRKEFVRFNPRRFNLYYLSGVAAAITITALVVFNSGKGQELIKTDTIKNDNIQVDEIAVNENATPLNADKNLSSENKPAVSSNSNNNSFSKQGSKNVDNAIINKDTASVLTERKEEFRPASEIKALHINTKAYFISSANSGCAPLKTVLTSRSEGAVSVKWLFDDGTSSSGKTAEKVFTKEGEHSVTLIATGPGGEVSSFTSVIIVFAKPVAGFKFLPEKPVIPDDVIRFENYSTDGVRYAWSFGDGKTAESFEPEHRYLKYGSYDVALIAFSENGCSDTAVIANAFAGSGSYINFPNAFIPNSDGPSGGYYSNKSDEAAQIFHPVSSGVGEYELKIFSKLGILVFQSNDINLGWDGYHKGQLCEPGVYVWKARGKFRNGESFFKSGDVTLIRSR